jgi:TatD DNase family protein
MNPPALPLFFDTHAHLDFPEFAPDLDAVLARAAAAGITRIISIGTDLESSRRAVELSGRHPEIFACVGWHPGRAEAAPEDIRPALRELAAQPKVVAIGETGLDYHHLPGAAPGAVPEADSLCKAVQARLFRQQLEVAAEFGLNCVIHQRDAFADTMSVMRESAKSVRGVFHCFVGTVGEMREVLAIGSLVSFTGILTFKNGANVRETLKETPLDRFMLETDCPYLAPVPYRGKRCEPAYVREIAAAVAGVKEESLERLSEATRATARDFFPRLRPS